MLMHEAKPGYLDGRRRTFEKDSVYQVDTTLFKAFVEDLRIASEYDIRAKQAVEAPEPQTEGGESEAETQASETEDQEGTSASEELPEWTLQVEPEIYLERWPEGPQAELARKILEADNAEGTPGNGG